MQHRQRRRQGREQCEAPASLFDQFRTEQPQYGVDHCQERVGAGLGCEVQHGQPGHRQGRCPEKTAHRPRAHFHRTHGIIENAAMDGSRTMNVPSAEPSGQPTIE